MSRPRLLAVILPLVCGCDPLHTGFDEREPAVMYRATHAATDPDVPSELAIMTWNIKYGGGRIRFFWECLGDRANMTIAEVESNLAGIAAKVNREQPDLVLLQEVDVEAKRTAYVDEVQYLLDHTHLTYGAYASQWRADYVPSDGVGRMDSGNAILSRWPLVDAERLALPLIGNEDALTRYFYLKRNILRARVARTDPPLWIVATHTEAFSDDGTKRKHIDRLAAEMQARAAAGGLVIGGGDLNEIPPNAPRRNDFPDDCTSGRYAGDKYLGEEDWLDGLFASFNPAASLDQLGSDPERWYTFSGDELTGWTRTLDYLFTTGTWQPGSALVHQGEDQGGSSTILLSDHAPLTATLELQP